MKERYIDNFVNGIKTLEQHFENGCDTCLHITKEEALGLIKEFEQLEKTTAKIEELLTKYDIENLVRLEMALDYYEHRFDDVQTRRRENEDKNYNGNTRQ